MYEARPVRANHACCGPTRVVQAGGNGVGGLRLAVAFLQDERAGTVENAHLVSSDRRGVSPRLEAVTGRLTTEQLDAGIIDERGE